MNVLALTLNAAATPYGTCSGVDRAVMQTINSSQGTRVSVPSSVLDTVRYRRRLGPATVEHRTPARTGRARRLL